MLGMRPAEKLGLGLNPSLAATDWKAVTEMLCDLFLGSCMTAMHHHVCVMQLLGQESLKLVLVMYMALWLMLPIQATADMML